MNPDIVQEVARIRERRERVKALTVERERLFQRIGVTKDTTERAALYTRFWDAGAELDSINMRRRYDDDVDTLLTALDQLEQALAEGSES